MPCTGSRSERCRGMIRVFLLALIFSLLCGEHLFAEPDSGDAVAYGTQRFVEYTPGQGTLIITSPHGGILKPEDMPDRATGVIQMDANTQELARAIAAEVTSRFPSGPPHLIVSHLHRRKLDPNREIVEAAQGAPGAEKAWAEYHRFIEKACDAAVMRHGVGLLIDIHGQAHKGERIEIGYLHKESAMDQADAIINTTAFSEKGSIALIARSTRLPYAELLRGPTSLGAFLQEKGYRCTPSPALPRPVEPYFEGGYTTARYGRADRRMIAIQIEANRKGVRDTPESRTRFAKAFVDALDIYFRTHMGMSLGG